MKKILIFLIIILGIGSFWYFGGAKYLSFTQSNKTTKEDVYVKFAMEAYDLIKQNYWNEPTKYDLATIFKLSLEKASNENALLATSTREGVSAMFSKALEQATTTEAKKNLIINTLIVATYNLEPAGRNGILSTKQETELRQNVSNVNPGKNLYQDLGLEKGASIEDVGLAFEKKSKELKASTSPQAKSELEQITYAKKVLTNNSSKELYDQNQIEPTVWVTKLDKTLYFYISKISPTTFVEFARAVDNASTTPGLNSMILDLRGNIGGDLAFVPNFMGLLLGQNQYSFDLFHQGEYQAQRTVQPKFDQLNRFSEIAVLTDSMTQSTAEVLSATLKRLHLAKTIGVHTRGWGTVENTYPITTEIDKTTKYTLLLVNSITLRDDNQPIEGRGVDPDIDTSDSKWKNKLSNYFHSSSLIKALENQATLPPIK
jgi:hypothetical protein